MTRRQLNKLSMLLALIEYLDGNKSILKSIPNLESILSSIKSSVNDIQSYSEQQIINRNGVGNSKKIKKSSLVAIAADIARKLSAFAVVNQNDVLLNECKTSDYKLLRLSDEKLTSICSLILDLGKQYLSTAAPFGLNQTTLDNLDANIKSFIDAIPEPRLAKVDKKQATDKLVELFDHVDELLDKSDILVGIVKLSQPKFFAGYKSSRTIIDRVGRGLQLKISVIEKSNGNPIQGALCKLKLEDSLIKSVLISKKTALKGSIKFKSLEEGKYNLSVSKLGYKPEIKIIYVTKNEFTNVIIELDKI